MNDSELLHAFLSKIEQLRLSNTEAGKAVGLSHEQIRKYKRGEWKRLAAGTKRKIEGFLRLQPVQESATYAEGVRHAVERMESVVAELRGLTAGGSAAHTAVKAGSPREGGPRLEAGVLPPLAAALIRLSQSERPELEAHVGPREAIALEKSLREAGRLSPVDEAIWQAYRMGRTDVPWSDLEPADRAPDLETLLLAHPATSTERARKTR